MKRQNIDPVRKKVIITPPEKSAVSVRFQFPPSALTEVALADNFAVVAALLFEISQSIYPFLPFLPLSILTFSNILLALF